MSDYYELIYSKKLYKGVSLLDWAIRWFKMDNDAFYNAYGFNFNPHNYVGLYRIARNKVYGK